MNIHETEEYLNFINANLSSANVLGVAVRITFWVMSFGRGCGCTVMVDVVTIVGLGVAVAVTVPPAAAGGPGPGLAGGGGCAGCGFVDGVPETVSMTLMRMQAFGP